MTKTVKIGIAVVLVVVAIVVIYFLLRKKAAANKYASAESITKAKSGSYGTWNNNVVGGDVNWYPYVDKCTSLFGANSQPYASAWLKGMNVSRSLANLDEFKADITKYVNNTSLRKNDWEVTEGEFLKSTPIAS